MPREGVLLIERLCIRAWSSRLHPSPPQRCRAPVRRLGQLVWALTSWTSFPPAKFKTVSSLPIRSQGANMQQSTYVRTGIESKDLPEKSRTLQLAIIPNRSKSFIHLVILYTPQRYISGRRTGPWKRCLDLDSGRLGPVPEPTSECFWIVRGLGSEL
ncbi:hypothetical protein BJX61DRAFT_123736 [Aspergillus egyptiacus]|nr:hypothetical protein BJX61DRAFT_123736 [Aspergillus egyptiacus]